MSTTTHETTPLLLTPGLPKPPIHRRLLELITSGTVLLIIAFVIVFGGLLSFLLANTVFSSSPPPTDLSSIPKSFVLRWSSNWESNGVRPYTFSHIDYGTNTEKKFAELRTPSNWDWSWSKKKNMLDLWEEPVVLPASQPLVVTTSKEVDTLTLHTARTWVRATWGNLEFCVVFGRSNFSTALNGRREGKGDGEGEGEGGGEGEEHMQRCMYVLKIHTFTESSLERTCDGQGMRPVEIARTSGINLRNQIGFHHPSDNEKIYAYADGRNLWDWKRKWDVSVAEDAPFPSAVVGALVAGMDTWNEAQKEDKRRKFERK